MFGFLKKFRDQFLNAAGRGVGEVEAEIHKPLYPVWDSYTAIVDPGKLFRGSRLYQLGMARAARNGIRTVIDLRAEATSSYIAQVQAAGLGYVGIPVIDNTVPEDIKVQAFLILMSKPDLLPVYVHCEAGIGRTGCFVAAYRVKVQGWTAAAALAEAREYGLGLPCQVEWISALSA